MNPTLNPTLVEKFLSLITLKNQDGTDALQQYVEPSGITNLIIRVDNCQTLINNIIGNYSLYLRALGFERKSKYDSVPNRKRLEFRLRQDAQNPVPVTIDSYAQYILPYIDIVRSAQDDSSVPGILANQWVQQALRGHSDTRNRDKIVESLIPSLLDRQYPAPSSLMRNPTVPPVQGDFPALRSLLFGDDSPPSRSPQPSSLNVQPVQSHQQFQQQIQQATLVSRNRYLQQLAGQSASGSQPGPSGFNPQFQPSNVPTGDQSGTSGLSRTQAGGPMMHQRQHQSSRATTPYSRPARQESPTLRSLLGSTTPTSPQASTQSSPSSPVSIQPPGAPRPPSAPQTPLSPARAAPLIRPVYNNPTNEDFDDILDVMRSHARTPSPRR
ncbi:hypothetical protein Xbed_03424 [Xenorhabdus beddingii]|uniref:Uncharacterized protein n=1 Tax=Xenorhabdus beddingii TaxID=40578 RepID=A0A1Y2SGS1_9GAMM|nr:hypothetical protein Xbed_03424 [Xenorhabdus beddingii]